MLKSGVTLEEDYLEQYQTALSSTSFNPERRVKALGLLLRMGLVAVHQELDEGPGRHTGEIFEEGTDEQGEGSKKKTVARRVGWTFGMVRQRIAEGFTADESLYDVLIANKIADEGLNLQTRICAICHGDLPWEPATLQQRNSRGQRQGNRYEVIHIYYILSKRSMDMARFQLIAGKREWMAALLESAASETNNPAAQAEMSPEDWLIYLSRDEEKTKQLLEQKKAKQREEEDQKIKKLAWASIRAISVRQRDIPNADLFQRTRLTEEISNLSELSGRKALPRFRSAAVA